MLPMMRTGPGSASPGVALFTAVSATCVTGLAVVDTPTYWSVRGPGRDPRAHPDRRLRHPGARDVVDPAAQPQARDGVAACRTGRDGRAHPGRRPSGAHRAGRHHGDRRVRRGHPPRGPVLVPLRPPAGGGRLEGRLPQHQRLQQRRFRPRVGLPDLLRPGPADPWADRPGHRARRPGLPGRPRALQAVHRGSQDRAPSAQPGDDPRRGSRPRSRAGPSLALPDGRLPPGALRVRQPDPAVAAHPPDAHRHRDDDDRRDGGIRPVRVGEPRHTRGDVLVGESPPGGLLRRHHTAHRWIQHGGLRRRHPRDAPAHRRADVRRRRQWQHRWWHQGDHPDDPVRRRTR